MNKLPLSTAILWILSSTFIVMSLSIIGLSYYRSIYSLRFVDKKYQIVALSQTCSEKEALQTNFLAELLQLSVDKPKNLYRFSCEVATQRLLAHSLIKSAEVSKIYPGTVHIHYRLRVPVAYLMDFENTAIDKEGVALPFKPYFTPKKLPEIYLGVKDEKPWRKKMEQKAINLAFEVLKVLKESYSPTQIQRIDVSQAFSSSYGKRQIVLILEEVYNKPSESGFIKTPYTRILRLSPSSFPEALKHYGILREHLITQKKILHEKTQKSPSFSHTAAIIDLRIPHLAFISA